MKDLEDKISQLIELSIQKTNSNSIKKEREMKNLILEIRKLARDEHTILGRIIRFPYEDKYSYYLITKINETTVTIECINLYEGYIDKGHGKIFQFDKVQADCYIRGVESILKMYPKEDILYEQSKV